MNMSRFYLLINKMTKKNYLHYCAVIDNSNKYKIKHEWIKNDLNKIFILI